MATEIRQNYRFHRNRSKKIGATEALRLARADFENGISRYPDSCGDIWRQSKPGLVAIRNPEKNGFRHVGDVEADCGGRNGIWDSRGKSGWYSDAFQHETFQGVVYQLPGRNGAARFVAGYKWSEECENVVTLDMSAIYEQPTAETRTFRGYEGKTFTEFYICDSAIDMGAAEDAARAADSLAERAAEDEREYQSAWQAGSRYAEFGEEIEREREELLEVLRERRQVKGTMAYPALCRAIRSTVESHLERIRDCRANRNEIKSGAYFDDIAAGFYTGDKRLREAFNEGAGSQVI